MEDTLRGSELGAYKTIAMCLNPCFNGRYSQRNRHCTVYQEADTVLILVLMEDTLRATNDADFMTSESVLILVLMEDTLRDRLFYSKP